MAYREVRLYPLATVTIYREPWWLRVWNWLRGPYASDYEASGTNAEGGAE